MPRAIHDLRRERFAGKSRRAVAPVTTSLLATFLLAALLLMSGATEAAGARDDDRDWSKLVSPNFELYANGRESEARRLLRELETFRHVVSRFLGLTDVQRRPALVYFFKDDASFQPYKPRYDGKPSIVSGFHSEDPLDYVLALGRQPKGSSTMHVLFHEYTHLLTSRQFRHAPVWAHEGVAEVFSTFEADNDTFRIGVALTNHCLVLQQNRPMPVGELLAVTRESPDYNEQSRAGRFYATSWLLAHHLVFARRGFETNVMARYADLCARTTNQVDAFRLAFGVAPDGLDGALRDYVRGGQYFVVKQTYPELEAARPRSVPPAPGETDYALGRLLQMTGQLEPAMTRLDRACQRAPLDARPREALALLAWRTGDKAALRGRVDEALRLGSRDAFVHFLAAQTRYEDAILNRRSSDVSATLAEGRKYCEKAVELDPMLAPAHHMLGVYVLTQTPGAPAIAAQHIQQALRCDPLYRPALVTWASVLAAQGNFGAARQILARVLAGPLPDDLRATARRIADEIEKRLTPANGSVSRPTNGAPGR